MSFKTYISEKTSEQEIKKDAARLLASGLSFDNVVKNIMSKYKLNKKSANAFVDMGRHLNEGKVTYALTSDDNMLANNTKDMIFDLEDQFGEDIISDYELQMADADKPKITLTFTKKGSKLMTKIKKELKANGFIK